MNFYQFYYLVFLVQDKFFQKKEVLFLKYYCYLEICSYGSTKLTISFFKNNLYIYILMLLGTHYFLKLF